MCFFDLVVDIKLTPLENFGVFIVKIFVCFIHSSAFLFSSILLNWVAGIFFWNLPSLIWLAFSFFNLYCFCL